MVTGEDGQRALRTAIAISERVSANSRESTHA